MADVSYDVGHSLVWMATDLGYPDRRASRAITTLPPMKRAAVAVLGLAVLFTTAGPAVAEEVVTRPFEEEIWNSPPQQTAEVAETLGLVDLRTLDLSRTQLVNGYAGRGLQVKIPTNGFRGLGPFDRLEPAPTEVWYRYHVRLQNWNAASTGKLPGLAGIYSSSARGCIKPTDSSRGWSARGMFGPPGTEGAPAGEVPIGTYLYHFAQEGDCGDGLWWGASLEQGRWHCVEGHVKLNTPGQNNGVFHGLLDGNQVFRKTDIQYRGPGQGNIRIRHMWHNVYFGGSWPTPNPLSLVYDQVVVSTSGRVGCLRAFTDIGQTVHAQSITELHALGYLHGCEYRKACPDRLLTRGEGAAFISRILGLPAASRDYFRDDEGSTFEAVINSLAAAGITKGCATRQFCPDRTMTRAEFATMLRRALHLGGSAPNAFSDDNGHTLENDINLFAAAGLTKGCGADRFCPDRALPRDEAASFFYRSLDVLQPVGLAGVEPPPEFPPPGDPPPIPDEERD